MTASIVFSDMDFELTIEDSDGQTIHKHRYQSVSDTVAWVWRELWISAFLLNLHSRRASLMTSKLSIPKTLCWDLFEQFFSEEGDEDDDKYQDVHWTPAMRAAASRILDDRHAARHVECNTNLSRATYNTLLQEYPSLKPMLLGTLRKHIFDAQTFNLSSTVYRSAAEMFAKDFPDDPPQTSRCIGLEIIEKGFCGVKSIVMSEIEDTFPRNGDANGWLQERKIAIGNSCGDSLYEEFGAWDDRNVGVNSNDSDYAEEMNAPIFSSPIIINGAKQYVSDGIK
ncbi:hypothetical protein F5876DRAFT_63781 [Lentinula aff. lateritia]|uniref:Uncharacterized protein n=1 Tax=Lentinula aff. lateritia TaxID=2804960 RepID=A0ACC1U772_9AGAR|nr:hypothetical protein F5876DRAFT_63781 [Lentinula aff. lateritia]